MSLRMADLPPREDVYTFVPSDTGEAVSIAASTLRRVVERRLQPIQAIIADSLRDALQRGDLGVEEEHALSLPDEALEMPILVCEWGENDHVIADGAHRLWRRWQRGDPDFQAYVVPEEVWRMFVIEDMPGSGEFWDKFNHTAKVRT